MNNTKDLLNLKEKIEKAKIKNNKLEGELESLIKTLDEKFKIKDLFAAKKEMEKTRKELEKEENEINIAIKILEEKYEW